MRATAIRLIAALAVAAGLAGCGESVMAPAEEVAARAYTHPGPSSLTLYTVINNRNGSGAHTGLLINGSQRVLWDPAGSFYHPGAPERNDLLYGIAPDIRRVYIDYHARITFRVVEQTVEVPREVADQAIRLAQQAGPVGPARCAISTAQILNALPGLDGMPVSYYPKALMNAFAELPGATARTITDEDADDNHGVIFTRRYAEDPID
ncbi:hypothetical protein DXV76_03950 [Rhodobacteraceae bacterium CCMM004]|nr:hypothetical protein DXV76_03950 [Rhodobacteraceae bacterium CCMM004]